MDPNIKNENMNRCIILLETLNKFEIESGRIISPMKKYPLYKKYIDCISHNKEFLSGTHQFKK
jgi:hypothetical protein